MEKYVLKAVWVVLFVFSVILISSAVSRYENRELHAEVMKLKKNKLSVQVINESEILNLFSEQKYDLKTQYEYLDILKILLNKSNIVLLQPEAVKFDNTAELQVYSVEVLRQRLNELGIENPRITNAEEYTIREEQQNMIINKLFSTPSFN